MTTLATPLSRNSRGSMTFWITSSRRSPSPSQARLAYTVGRWSDCQRRRLTRSTSEGRRARAWSSFSRISMLAKSMSVPALKSTRTSPRLRPELALMRSILLSVPSVCSSGKVTERSISSGEELLYWTRAVIPEEEMVGNCSMGKRSKATTPTTKAHKVIIRVVTGRLSENSDRVITNLLSAAIHQGIDHRNEYQGQQGGYQKPADDGNGHRHADLGSLAQP